MTKKQEQFTLWISVGLLTVSVLTLAVTLSALVAKGAKEYATLYREVGEVKGIATDTRGRVSRIESLLLGRKEAQHGGDTRVQRGPGSELVTALGLHASDDGGGPSEAD